MTSPAKGSELRPYHHGTLRLAMLEASELILRREGIAGLTLRAAAREAGASHAAPKNHFGDLTGLLSELAAIGYQRLADCLQEASNAAQTPASGLSAIGLAYVDFATANLGLFQLMFRSERLDNQRPALQQAFERTSSVLTGVVATIRDEHYERPHSLSRTAEIVTNWALVHGFAMLLLDGRLAPFVERLEGQADIRDLLSEMVNARAR